MKIEIEENDLVYLLRCADDSAILDESERGDHAGARETRKLIEEMIRKINDTAGCTRWKYSDMYGVLRYDDGENDDKEAADESHVCAE